MRIYRISDLAYSLDQVGELDMVMDDTAILRMYIHEERVLLVMKSAEELRLFQLVQ